MSARLRYLRSTLEFAHELLGEVFDDVVAAGHGHAVSDMAAEAQQDVADALATLHELDEALA